MSATSSTTISAVLPGKGKPSKVLSTDRTRPVLCSAYLRRRDEGFELQATDSFIAVRIPVRSGDAELTEGYVPADALKAIERGKERAFNAANGRVEVDEGRVSYLRPEPGKFLDLDAIWAKREMKEPLVIGLNTKLLRHLAEALGDDAVKFEIDLAEVKDGRYLRAFRVTPSRPSDAEGLMMPIRIPE